MTAAASVTSRPLRALVVVVGGWIGGRTAALWPTMPPPLAPLLPAGSAPFLPIADLALLQAPHVAQHDAIGAAAASLPVRTAVMPPARRPPPRNIAARLIIPSPDHATAVPLDQPMPGHAAPPPRAPEVVVSSINARPSNAPHDRVSASAWLLLRGKGETGLAPSGTLGGSQVGVRVFYEPGPPGIALTARISTPLALPTGREAAVGIALRHGNAGLIVEQRIALDRGARTAPSITAFAGFSGLSVGGKFRVDGYGQAGIVGLAHPAGFADGALRIEHPLADIAPIALAVGAGSWGGVQPGLSRLDIGPQIVARVPVAGKVVRITGEWRVRVAGNADPASGAAVTIGIDL